MSEFRVVFVRIKISSERNDISQHYMLVGVLRDYRCWDGFVVEFDNILGSLDALLEVTSLIFVLKGFFQKGLGQCN